MHFDLTIDSPDGDLDVRVDASAPPALGAVRAALLSIGDLPPAAVLHSDGRAVRPDAVLGTPGLGSGTRLTTTAGGADSPTAHTLQVLSGPSAGDVHALRRSEYIIGRSAECDVVLADDGVSRRHASLSVGTRSMVLRDRGSTNGTTIDGVRVPNFGTVLTPGAVARIGDSLLAVAAPNPVAAPVVAAGDVLLVGRPPRVRPAPASTTIEAAEAEPAPRPRPVQWLGALMPAVASAGIAWATGSAMFLVFGLLSPLMLVSTALGDRLHWRRSRRRSAAELRQARHRVAAEVADALVREAAQRRDALPDPPTLAGIAATPGVRIWERRPSDTDWLAVRIGTASLVSAARIRSDDTTRPAGLLPPVPVRVDLACGAVGLAGPPRIVDGVARWVLAQLVTLHSPAELEVMLVLAAPTASWAWIRWLPHLRDQAARLVDDPLALLADLSAEMARRRAGRPPGGRAGSGTPSAATWPRRWTVVLVGAGLPAETAARLTELLTGAAALGVTALWLGDDRQSLPSLCVCVVQHVGGAATRAVVHGGASDGVHTALDSVQSVWADSLARRIAPLAVAETEVGDQLPDECSLRELLELTGPDTAEQVIAAWSRSNGTADTVLGAGRDGPLRVDLDADGPHSLIAGTTGSGKSQLLQALVIGLAAMHPPHELTFLLVDYKGGAAFAECADLPHCAGLVTDLDPHLTQRALRSLEAELRRRERLLANVRAADLTAYRQTQPVDVIPRLVIVVDEFATLAEELPDFVTGLVGVAQRGRSLGIHLVLATQRPGAAVSPAIRANTSLRIALRVTDAAESLDVVGVENAAAISPGTPGRAVLRTGAGLHEFQSARVSGPQRRADDTPRVIRLGPWRQPPAEGGAPDGQGLADLVSVVQAAARTTGAAPAQSPWRPPLPDLLPMSELAPNSFAAQRGGVVIGAVDLPSEQAQTGLELPLDPPSSTLVVGAPRSGRTTALAATALAAAAVQPPDALELHVVDPIGDLLNLIGTLPHIGTALGPNATTLVPTLLERLATGGSTARLCLLVIDAWETFLAAHDDGDAVHAQALLTAALRSSPGVSVVLAADRTLMGPRFSGSFENRLALRLADRSDYAAFGIAVRAVPDHMPPGRCLRAVDGAEAQIAVPGVRPGIAAADVPEALRRAVADLGRPPRATPQARLRLRPLPSSVGVADTGPAGGRLRVGVGGDAAETITLDPFDGARRWLVAGPPRSGRSSTLVTLLSEGCRVGLDLVVSAPPRSPLAEHADRLGVAVITPSSTVGEYPPAGPTLLLVDDGEAFADTEAGERLLRWARDTAAPLSVVLAGRADELAVAYRGLGAEVRRSRAGIALRPGPVDGELFGARLRRALPADPPGRGYLVGDPAWSVPAGRIVPVQLARVAADVPAQPMWGYR